MMRLSSVWGVRVICIVMIVLEKVSLLFLLVSGLALMTKVMIGRIRSCINGNGTDGKRRRFNRNTATLILLNSDSMQTCPAVFYRKSLWTISCLRNKYLQEQPTHAIRLRLFVHLTIWSHASQVHTSPQPPSPDYYHSSSNQTPISANHTYSFSTPFPPTHL